MAADRSASFRSKKWIGDLRDYAQHLSAWLSADLRRLSDTGLNLGNAERMTLMVQKTDLQAERKASWRGDGRDGTEVEYGPKRENIAPPIEDLKMLEDWLASRLEPLLLLAPFGSENRSC
jgi:hypothetical protein